MEGTVATAGGEKNIKKAIDKTYANYKIFSNEAPSPP